MFRVFDDGVGFRYVLPEQRAMAVRDHGGGHAIQVRRATSPAWWIPAQYGPGSGDEDAWNHTAAEPDAAAATPMTIDAGAAGYVTLHEANLIDYAA